MSFIFCFNTHGQLSSINVSRVESQEEFVTGVFELTLTTDFFFFYENMDISFANSLT